MRGTALKLIVEISIIGKQNCYLTVDKEVCRSQRCGSKGTIPKAGFICWQTTRNKKVWKIRCA